jgi:hypothetical protein
MKTEREILNELRQEGEDAQELFSNSGLGLRERLTVAGLLRVLGIDFRPDEIVKRGPEPIDVWFRDARFQVTEVLDAGRPRNREMRKRAERFRSATSLRKLSEPGIIESHPILVEELASIVWERAREKAQRYVGDVGGIDLLVYVNLSGRHIFPARAVPKPPPDVPWRSVSAILEGSAAIFWATDEAPPFLIERRYEVVPWSYGPDSVFPLRLD